MRSLIHLISWLKAWLSLTANEETGQDLVEYGLIIALIAIVAVAALTTLGSTISSVLGNIAGSL